MEYRERTEYEFNKSAYKQCKEKEKFYDKIGYCPVVGLLFKLIILSNVLTNGMKNVP